MKYLLIILLIFGCSPAQLSSTTNISCGGISLELPSSFKQNTGFYTQEEGVDFCYYQYVVNSNKVQASFQVLKRPVDYWDQKTAKELKNISNEITSKQMEPLLKVDEALNYIKGPFEVKTKELSFSCYKTLPEGSNVVLGLVCNAATPKYHARINYHLERNAQISEVDLNKVLQSVRFN